MTIEELPNDTPSYKPNDDVNDSLPVNGPEGLSKLQWIAAIIIAIILIFILSRGA